MMNLAKSFKDGLPIRNGTTPLRPVSPGERIPALDVVRGFALFGVLLAYTLWNMALTNYWLQAGIGESKMQNSRSPGLLWAAV